MDKKVEIDLVYATVMLCKLFELSGIEWKVLWMDVYISSEGNTVNLIDNRNAGGMFDE